MEQGDEGSDPAELRRMSLLHGRVPANFVLRMWVVAPGETVPYDDAQWAGSLVTVEDGEIELRCGRGGNRRFGPGAMLALDGLGLVSMRGCGPRPTVLAALSRRSAGEPSTPSEGGDLAVDGGGGPDAVAGGEQVEEGTA